MSQTTARTDRLDDVPVHAGMDLSLALLREGYRFTERRRRDGAGPTPAGRVVELRLLGRRAVLAEGPAGAARPPRHQPRSAAVAVPRPLRPGPFRRALAGPLLLPPARRRRPCHGPSLPG